MSGVMEPEPRSHFAFEVVPNEYDCGTKKLGGGTIGLLPGLGTISY